MIVIKKVGKSEYLDFKGKFISCLKWSKCGIIGAKNVKIEKFYKI